jgi:mRNA-degrading endonuclease toxin of MazEF toxin-antitoxin module
LSPADPPHAYGDIVVVADMLDPRGHYPKDRPCVIVTEPGLTPEGWELVVAISTQLPDPLPDDYVLLPYMDPRHPRTGLNKRNAAIGGWVEVIEESRIIRKLGHVPGKQIKALTEILARLYPPGDEVAGE